MQARGDISFLVTTVTLAACVRTRREVSAGPTFVLEGPYWMALCEKEIPMNRRVNTVACALLVSALVVPASQADTQRAPVTRHQLVAHARTSAFAGLGHEGGALRKVEASTSAFANLGVEGSALVAKWEAAAIRPWA